MVRRKEMKLVTEQEAYENLANAIVLKAFEDMVKGYIRAYKNHSRDRPRYCREAEAFLRNEARLQLYTNITSEYLIEEAQRQIKFEKENIDLERMYREYEKGIYYE